MPTKDQVLALHRDGVAPTAIAKQLKLTPSTVYRALRNAGVGIEHSTAKGAKAQRALQAPQVRELAEGGVSPTQICAQLNLGYDTLRKIADEHDIPLAHARAGRPSKKDQFWPQVQQMLADGQSQTEISRALGLKLGTLANWISDAGISYTRIDRTDHTANLGATPEERAQNGAAGGKAAAEGLATVYCLYPPCGDPVARTRNADGRMSRDRYCTREHAYAARREYSGKTSTYVCQYEKCEDPEFTWWTSQPRKYCSKKHYHLANKGVPEYGFEGQLLQSGYEAAFVGLCSIRGIKFEFFDRSDSVEWNPGNWYGPDFKVLVHGAPIYVDTKGAEAGSPKWARFRTERGRLVILRREGIDMLMRETGSATETLAALKIMAVEQEH